VAESTIESRSRTRRAHTSTRILVSHSFEGYFERLSPLLRAAGGAKPEIIAALGPSTASSWKGVPTVCERFALTFG